MKKQMKLLLFALLVVLLVATMAVVVSAAGDAIYTEGTHYYKVTIEGTDNYYANLNAAIADVPNGGTIYVLADVPAQPKVTLTKEGYTYTITSEGTAKYTITMSGGATNADAFYITKGVVTLKNLNIADGGTKWQTLMRATGNEYIVSDANHVYFENVTAEFSSSYGLWWHQSYHLTATGFTHINDAGEYMRFNGGARYSKVTFTDSVLSGTRAYIQTEWYALFTNTTITGYIQLRNYTIKDTKFVGCTINGYIHFEANLHVVVAENTTFNTTVAIAKMEKTGQSLTLTNCTLNLKGEGAKLASSDTYLKQILATNLVVNYESGANVSTFSQLKEGSSVSSQAVKDTATFVLSGVTGSKSIGTMAQLVALIKSDANYASFTIPEAWHPIVMDNDDLKIILSGDALAQQSGEAPFITATAGTLIAIEKGVTTCVAGTHFFKTAIEGTYYFYETLADAIDEVVNDGVIYLVADAKTDALTLDNGKTFAIDGGESKYTLTVTPVSFADINGSTGYTALFHPCLGDFTFRNIKFALGGGTAPSVLIWMQNTTTDATRVKVTLDNVDLQVTSTYGLWLHGSATLTVKGEGTVIKGGTNNTVRVQAGATNSVITLKHGKYAIGSNLVDIMAPKVTMTIENGTYTTSTAKGYAVYLSSGATSAKVNIQGGTFNTGYQAVYMGSVCASGTMSVVTISGGTFNYIGASMTANNSYIFNITQPYNKLIFPAGGTAVINAGANTKSIICTNSKSASSVVEVLSGTFDGGQSWLFSNRTDTFTFGGTVVFKDTNNTLKTPIGTTYVGAINITQAVNFTITGGTYSLHASNTTNTILYSHGAATVKFQPASGSTIAMTGGKIVKMNAGTLTVTGGTYTANNAAGALFEGVASTITLNNCTVTAKYHAVLASGATTINVGGTAYLTSDNANWKATVALSANNAKLNISGSAVIEHTTSTSAYTILASSGKTGIVITMSDNATVKHTKATCAFALYQSTVNVTGGTIESPDTAFGIYASATINVSGATIKANSAFYLANAGTVVTLNFTGDNDLSAVKSAMFATSDTFGKDKTLTAANVVVTTEKPIALNCSVVKLVKENVNMWLKGGSFTSTKDYTFHVMAANVNLTVEGVTATSTYYNGSSTGMFYMNSDASGCTLTVKGGNYTAPKMMNSYSSTGTQVYTFESGTFTSNAQEGKGDAFIHVQLYGTTLNILGGEFYANENNTYLINSNNGGHASFETHGSVVKTLRIENAKFDGGTAWIFANSAMNATIKNATFTDVNNTLTDCGIRILTNNDKFDGEISSLIIKSGSFTTHPDSKAPIFWLDEETVTIEDGTFTADRIAAIKASGINHPFALSFNGGIFNIRGDKAIVLPNLYGGKNIAGSSITFNGGVFLMGEDATALVYGNTATLAALSINALTIYTKSSTTAVYGQLKQNDLYIFDSSMPCLMVPANSTVAKFGGEIYNVYHASASTGDVDVSNSDDTFKGASVYVSANADVSGIRFYTVLSKETIAALSALSFENIQFGTVIAPIDYVVAVGGFTIEKLETLTGVKGDKYQKIPAVNSVRDVNEKGIPASYSAALVNLKETNYTRGFAAISYVEIDGVIYYGSFSSTENVRSIRDVAKKLIALNSYYEDQLDAIVKFAGFNTTAGAVSTTFTAGKINLNGAIVSANGYVYSDLIHLEKAGTVVTFTGEADGNTLVISQYDAQGNALDYADNYAGDDAAVAYTYGNTTTYSYVSSFDNEYIRVCYKTSAPAVYASASYATGTLKSDLQRYNGYMLNKLAYAGGYYEDLAQLDVVAIGDSYFNDPAVIPNMWIDQLTRKYNINLYNYGISGSTMANDSSSPSNPMVLRVKGAAQKQSGTGITIEMSQTPNPNVDIVFLEGGRNDFTTNPTIGAISLDNKNEATVCGAINVMIEHLRKLYPNAMIVGMSCWGYNGSYSVTRYNTETGEDETLDMKQADFSRQIYEIYLMNGIVAFDSSDIELSGVNVNDASFREHNTKGFGDVSHLNAYGAAKFLPTIEKFVAEAYAEHKKG